jgi:autotransporter-associated beta strand protein
VFPSGIAKSFCRAAIGVAAILCVCSLAHASREGLGLSDPSTSDYDFATASSWFSNGPAWLMNALPGSRRPQLRHFLDETRDPTDPPAAYSGYVGTLRDTFDVGLFSNVSAFAVSSGLTSKPPIPNSSGGGGVFYLGSGGNWDDPTAWGPTAGIYPDAISAVASDLQEVSGSIIQNVSGINGAGVTVGIIDHNPTSPFNSANGVTWTITTDNPIQLNNGTSPAQINISQAEGTNFLIINGTAGLKVLSSVNITNANANGLLSITAPITGPGSITTGGIGTTLLTGNNSFSGSTTVNAGTLNVGAEHALGGTSGVTVNASGTLLFSGNTTDRIRNDAPVSLNGGTLNTAGLSEGTATAQGLGALTLAAASTIDLSSGSSIISFADSHGQTWNGALRILNWTGTVGVGDGTDQVYFGTDTNGLTSTQLNQISFYSDGGTTLLGTAQILADGEIIPLAPVPEASTWFAAALALGATAFISRRRLMASTRRFT